MKISTSDLGKKLTKINVDFLIDFIELENLTIISQLAKQYGNFFCTWIGFKLNVFLTDPKDIEVPEIIKMKKIYSFTVIS